MLHSGSYDWQFHSVAGSTYTDIGQRKLPLIGSASLTTPQGWTRFKGDRMDDA